MEKSEFLHWTLKECGTDYSFASSILTSIKMNIIKRR